MWYTFLKLLHHSSLVRVTPVWYPSPHLVKASFPVFPPNFLSVFFLVFFKERKKNSLSFGTGGQEHRGQRGRKSDKKNWQFFFYYTNNSAVTSLHNYTCGARTVPCVIPTFHRHPNICLRCIVPCVLLLPLLLLCLPPLCLDKV